VRTLVHSRKEPPNNSVEPPPLRGDLRPTRVAAEEWTLALPAQLAQGEGAPPPVMADVGSNLIDAGLTHQGDEADRIHERLMNVLGRSIAAE